MTYIKELNVHGFKSFARETKIPFRETMNVIVGPNGSGKSNVTDAICFVLGRLGSKSMRAKKLANLIFAGTDKFKPSSEASVEMVFDNKDRSFSVERDDVSVKRILRRNGQSIYKINNEVRTRNEILELLIEAGIDPNGFNLVLQGEIDAFVKMPPDKRREIIEEVAGISVYEIRKQKSIKELEKTDQRLKEVGAILRERNAYLKNLEQERKQALRFKKLQQEIKDLRASIFHKTIQGKQSRIEEVEKQIEDRQKQIAKIVGLIEKNNHQISLLNEKISHITENIQKQSGLQQDKLNNEISDLRADLAGLTIRKENAQNNIADMQNRKKEILGSIESLEQEIKEMSKEKGKIKPVKGNLDEKKKKLTQIDEARRKLYQLKSNLSAFNTRLTDKQANINKAKNEADFTLSRIEQIETEIIIKNSLEQHQEAIVGIKTKLEKNKQAIESGTLIINEKEKTIAALEMQMEELEKVKSKVSSLDICPLCKTKITKEHVHDVVSEAKQRQDSHKKEIESSKALSKQTKENIEKLTQELEKLEQELATRSKDVLRLELIKEKKDTLRRLSKEVESLQTEYKELETKKSQLEKQILGINTSEENYDSLRLDIQEMERQREIDVGMEVTMKQREVDRRTNLLRQLEREHDEVGDELKEITEKIEEKQTSLDEKNKQDEAMKQKFKKTLEEKNQFQEKIRFFESDLLHKQNDKQKTENWINELKIQRAQFAAQKEAAEEEAQEFKGAKIMRMPVEALKTKLQQTQNIVDNIGTVNMRALDVYEDVKKEYDKIQEKADTLLEEKQEILHVIEDIDKKKKKVFVETLKEINHLFSRNFSQLSTKGVATLEPVDKDNMFESGIEMLIKVGKGKYFDTHSLSGGERALVSLSLIFAIQEFKPYCFYIFDEIDAALDRRNSERLANLLKKYMKSGQYIIITHNDSLITEAPRIYGVSMQDKISKVVSLEV